MPPRRKARGCRASASVQATDSDRCNEEQHDKASSACGRGKRKVPVRLSPRSDLAHPVAGASGDLLEVADDRKSLTEPLPRRILRSELRSRVVANESGDCPPLKKRRSEPVKLKQKTSPKERVKSPGSVSQLLSYSPVPAVETGEDGCMLSLKSAAANISLSVKKPNKIVAVETDPNADVALASKKTSSDIQVKEVDNEKVLTRNDTPSQSGAFQPDMRNELPVNKANHLNEMSSSSLKGPLSGFFVSDYLDTALKIRQENTGSKPVDNRRSFERMTSRNIMDCLRIESEEDFKPDYDEDDKQDAAGNVSARDALSTKSSSSHSHVTTSFTRPLSAPFQASPAFLPATVGVKSTLLFQPCTSAQKCFEESGKAGDGDAVDGTHMIPSRKEKKDSLNLVEIFRPDLTDCPLSDADEESESAIMNDLNRLDDVQFLSRLSQHVPRSPVSVSNPVPRRVVKVSGGSKPLNLVSKFQSLKNKSTVDLSKCITRPDSGSGRQRHSGCVTPDATASSQVSRLSSESSFHVSETVFKGIKALDAVQPNSTFSYDLSPKDGVNSSTRASCLSLSSDASGADRLTQSIAVQTDQTVGFSSVTESDNLAPPLCLLPRNTEQQQPESNDTISSPLEGPHVSKVLTASEDSNVAKTVCQVINIPNSTFPSLPTTKSRISQKMLATAGSERVLKNVVSEPILEDTISLSVDDNSNPGKIRLKRPWKMANKKTDGVSNATNTSSAKVISLVSSAKVTSPVSSVKVISFVSSAKATSLVSSAKVTSPIKSAKATSLVSSAKVTSPVKSAKVTSPVSSVKVISFVSSAKATSLVSSAKVTSPVKSAKATSLVSSAKVTSPVKSAKVTSLVKSAKVTSLVKSAKVTSPAEKSLMLQVISNPNINVCKGWCEADVSSSNAMRMKQLIEVEMDVSPRVLLSSPALHVSASVLRQSSKESGASEELLEGDGSSNEEEFLDEMSLSLPTSSRKKQSSPALFSHRSPVACSQHSLNQTDEILTKSLLSAEETQLNITDRTCERSTASSSDPESTLNESSFANDVALWVSQKETKTDSLLKSSDVKKADWSLSAFSKKAYTSDRSLDLFEELTCEEFGSDFEDFCETSSTKDTLCETLLQSATAGGSLSSEEAVSSFEKHGLPIPGSSNSLAKTGWFPIPSRSTVIPVKTSVVLPPSESMAKRKAALCLATQSSGFITEELPAKRFPNTLPAVTNRIAGTKNQLVTKPRQPETVDDVFQRIRNLMEKQDWKSLSQLILISSERELYMAYLAEALMSISDINIKFSFKKLVVELETSSASEIPSFKKYVIGLVGLHVMERCTAFGNWSDAFAVLSEMLTKKISFHLSFGHEHSAADIVDTAVRVCVKVKKYDMIDFLVRQFDFFRDQLTVAMDQKSLIKQKYCCLNVVLVAIVQELPGTEGQMQNNGNDKLVLCNIGISILTQILEDWEEDVSKQPEVAELIELTCMFEFLIQGCIVHSCSDGLIVLSQLQARHPEYLEWKSSTLRMVMLFFLRLGMMRVLLSDELPLNLIQTATEHQLIPKLPVYVPSNSNVLVVWSSLSYNEMQLVILMYLKSILLRVHGLNLSSVPWSIQLVHRGPVVSSKSSLMDSMNSLQRLLRKDVSPSLRWSKLSPTLLHTDDCTVSVIRTILNDASIDLNASCCASLTPHSLLVSEAEPVGAVDVDLRQLPWNIQHSNLKSRMGFTSLPTTQQKQSDETLQPQYHFSTPQNRSSGVIKSVEDNRNNKGLFSIEPNTAASAKLACENPNRMPAKKMRALSVPKFARKDGGSSIAGPSSARKVLLKTPQCAEESPKLLQADASVARMDLRPNPAVGSFVRTPSNALDKLSDASLDREMQWNESSSRRRRASFFQKQNAGASSSDTGLRPQQQDLRQRLANKKGSRLVELPSNAGTPVKKLLDLALPPRSSPPYLPFK